MNINTVKKHIQENMGVFHHFKFHGSRNQLEEFDGVITELYPAIFIIQLCDGSIRSFSYGDFIIHYIEIVS